MKKTTFLVVSAGISWVMLGGCMKKAEKVNTYTIVPNAHSTVTPVSRTDKDWWMPRHRAIVERVKQGNVDLIFIGDSITHRWEREGKEVWQQYYSKRNAINMGFGGDGTQHVLWRLDNGEIAGISPKMAVVMIGTNNLSSDTVTTKEVGEGIIAICQKLRKDLPRTKILILAIFPRGEKSSPIREKIAEASNLASTIADNKWIFYMDINNKFLDKEGALSKDIMPDSVHPNAKGYQIEAETIEPMVKKLMGEK
jgi:lysophospholipase L1-like esterase